MTWRERRRAHLQALRERLRTRLAEVEAALAALEGQADDASDLATAHEDETAHDSDTP